MTAPAAARAVDLNADLGEGVGDDDAVLDVVTSASIACGGHTGDHASMTAAVRAAAARGVVVGAHPSYRDPEHFGRRRLDVDPDDLLTDLLGQVRALAEVAREQRVAVRYLKAHGALYNTAMVDDDVASVVVAVARLALASPLPLLALPGSVLQRRARAAGLRVLREGFADRAERADGTLVPRGEPGALITDVDALRARAGILGARVETVCVHGDSPHAVTLARAAREGLEEASLLVRAAL